MNIGLSHTPIDCTVAEASVPQSSSGNRHGGTCSLTGEDEAAVVTLSSNPQALLAQVDQLPDVRSDRVQALRSSLQSGTYQVNAGQIAIAVYGTLLGGN
jgi:flagellar biosynthesis anti-sigma factor FlgM